MYCCYHAWDHTPKQEHATLCSGRTSRLGTKEDYITWGRADTPKLNKLQQFIKNNHWILKETKTAILYT